LNHIRCKNGLVTLKLGGCWDIHRQWEALARTFGIDKNKSLQKYVLYDSVINDDTRLFEYPKVSYRGQCKGLV
jgi:hypothetical protein